MASLSTQNMTDTKTGSSVKSTEALAEVALAENLSSQQPHGS